MTTLINSDDMLVRAFTTGEYELCVKAMLNIQKHVMQPLYLKEYERYLRLTFSQFDPQQRINTLMAQISVVQLPAVHEVVPDMHEVPDLVDYEDPLERGSGCECDCASGC